ncbi:MAG TPA: hypothetical protein VE987_13380 [Polyangiaceae bacterium]|nr:hypothetical protein [Polyangiaceae bacterium]
MNGNGDHWYVQLADGDVHRVTLDQLDEAFQLGHVNAHTMVLAAGSSRWARLGQLAGIDAPGPATAYSERPVSMDLSDVLISPPARAGRRWLFAVMALAVATGSVASIQHPAWTRRYQPYLAGAARAARASAYATNWTPWRHAATPATAAAAASPPPVAATPLPTGPTATSPAPAQAPTAFPAAAGVEPAAAPSTAATAAAFPSTKEGPAGRPPPRHEGTATRKAVTAVPKAARAAPPPAPPAKSRPSVFTTGGNKYDPLNSSI